MCNNRALDARYISNSVLLFSPLNQSLVLVKKAAYKSGFKSKQKSLSCSRSENTLFCVKIAVTFFITRAWVLGQTLWGTTFSHWRTLIQRFRVGPKIFLSCQFESKNGVHFREKTKTFIALLVRAIAALQSNHLLLLNYAHTEVDWAYFVSLLPMVEFQFLPSVSSFSF